MEFKLDHVGISEVDVVAVPMQKMGELSPGSHEPAPGPRLTACGQEE